MRARLLSVGAILGVATAVLVISAAPAQAYIDPGTGSYILQVVAATVLAALFVVKTTWRQFRARIAGIFTRRTGTGPQDGD